MIHVIAIGFTLVATNGAVGAQVSPVSWFGHGSGGVGIAATDMSVVEDDQNCLCPNYSSGRGWYASMVAGARVLLAAEASTDTELALAVGIGGRYNSITLREPGDSLPSLDADGNVVYSITEFVMDMYMSSLLTRVALYGRWQRLSAYAGADLSMVVSGEATRNIDMVEPDDVKWDPNLFPGPDYDITNDGRRLVRQRLDETKYVQWQPQIVFGMGYAILEHRPRLEIFLDAVLPLGSIFTDYQYRVTDIGLGVSVAL